MNDLLFFAVLLALLVAVSVWREWRRRRRASQWPIAEGYIAQIEEKWSRHGLLRSGFLKVTLAYTYKVGEERYVGRESFIFFREDQAARFEAGCRQRNVLVHYDPQKPHRSVLARERMV